MRGSVSVETTLHATTMLGVITVPVLRGSQAIHPGQLAFMFKLLHKSLNKVALLYCYNHLLDPHMLCVNQDIIMNLLFLALNEVL